MIDGRDHDLLEMPAEQFNDLANRFELQGNILKVMRLACVEQKSVSEIAAELHLEPYTVRDLLSEAQIIVAQAEYQPDTEERQVIDSYRNRQPSEGRTPADVTLRSPVEGVEELDHRGPQHWRGGARVDVLGRDARHDGRETKTVTKWVQPGNVQPTPAPWVFCSCGNLMKMGDKTPLKGLHEIRPHPACGREPNRYHPLFVPREGEA
jgi:hypothetical protein